ncbi:hypothetical protein NC652_018651 [Populus alba x Populus x berolinensis]|nr:hypothetical protein NC652_018651 [Populus alba x Populus x berolinensis]
MAKTYKLEGQTGPLKFLPRCHHHPFKCLKQCKSIKMLLLTSLMVLARISICNLGGGCTIGEDPDEGAVRNGQEIVLAPEAGELDNWFGHAEAVGSLSTFCFCLSFSEDEDINSTGSILGAEDRPEAIVVVGNAFSGGTAGLACQIYSSCRDANGIPTGAKAFVDNNFSDLDKSAASTLQSTWADLFSWRRVQNLGICTEIELLNDQSRKMPRPMQLLAHNTQEHIIILGKHQISRTGITAAPVCKGTLKANRFGH